MIRSLHVINGLGTGGAERSLAELLPELRDFGISPVAAVLYERHEGVEEQARAAGIDVVRLTSTRLPGRVSELRGMLRSRRIDVVHSTIAEANMVARFACARGGPPLLTSIVNTPYAEERIAAGGVAPRKLEVLRRVEQGLAPRMTAHFHAITEAVASHAVEHLDIDRSIITVIPRGRRLERLGTASDERRAAARRSLGIAPDTTVLLNVGRREPQKGQIHLLHALRLLLDLGIDVQCLVAGREGTASALLDNAVGQLRLEDHVQFLGHREDVPELQVAADVFVFPSMYEGLGGALLEAMALETPIVASDVPAVREVLDDGRCGVLVPAGQPAALADGIHRVLSSDSAAMTGAALRRFSSVYDHEAVVRQMAALLRAVAEGSPPHQSGTTP